MVFKKGQIPHNKNKTNIERYGEEKAKEIFEKSSKSQTGRKQSPETIEKRASKLRNKKRPPRTKEWGENISAGLTGKKRPPRTPEYVKNFNDAQFKRRKRVKLICKYCGGDFDVIPFYAKIRKFCKPRCCYDYKTGKPCKNKGRTRSLEERIKTSLTMTNDTEFTGFKTQLNRQIRKSVKSAIWRNNIFKRDDYKCQICGRVGITLNAHHIKSFNNVLKDNCLSSLEEALECEELWDISNGVTLCVRCHKNAHKNL